MLRRVINLVFAISLLMLLGACEEESLYTALSEQEANEMVALLHKAGLPASKVAVKDSRFSVATEQHAFADAVSLLQENGLPRRRFESLGDVFNDEGFVSSNTSQRARYMYALSQEISNTISSIDGVVKARVHLAVPERDPLADVKVQSSASVFIKHRADVDLSGQVSQIKALVINGLENLPYANVTVALFEAQSQSFGTSLAPAKKPVVSEYSRAKAESDQAPSESPTAQTSSEAALTNRMTVLPDITPLGLLLMGLVLLACVLSALLCSHWLRASGRDNSRLT